MAMTCEEFEEIGLGLEHEGGSAGNDDSTLRSAVNEHVRTCARCAGLRESWRAAQAELQALRDITQPMETPVRVEMRLRQEFRTRRRTARSRRAAVVAAWALAAAAVLVSAVSWESWRMGRRGNGRGTTSAAAVTGGGKAAENASSAGADGALLLADSSAGDFTLLPGSFGQDTEDSEIVRVRMQRGALEALGLPVNEERAAEWIQVDLLIGEDGHPQAVRLPETSGSAAARKE